MRTTWTRRSPWRIAAGALLLVTLGSTAAGPPASPGSDAAYRDELQAWRARADASLRRDRGWLSIVDRWELEPGVHRVGAASGNQVILPKALSPATLGTITVRDGSARLALAAGHTMRTVLSGEPGVEFSERELLAGGQRIEWITAGRLSLQVVKRDDGRFVLRAADRDALTLGGATVRLDALDDDGDLFVIFRDATSAKTTYPAGRFLSIRKPADGAWVVDFNKAFNPPCAFSAYTTCPLPPPQNWMKAAVPAGERYADRKS